MSRRRPLHSDSVSDIELEEKELETPNGELPSRVPCFVPCEREGPFNPLAWLAVPWHLAMVVFYALLLHHGADLVNANAHILESELKIPSYGGRFKFLTHINLWVQLGFFTIQLLADLSPAYFKRHLQKFADVVFTSMAFPLAAMATIAFWGIYAIDRNLIYPEVYDKFVPTYINHLWHTISLLWVLCEIYLFYHYFPSTATAAATIFICGSAYNLWVVHVFMQTEFWCYPFFKFLPPYAMALFLGSTLFVNLGLYLVGKGIARMRWGMVTLIEGF